MQKGGEYRFSHAAAPRLRGELRRRRPIPPNSEPRPSTSRCARSCRRRGADAAAAAARRSQRQAPRTDCPGPSPSPRPRCFRLRSTSATFRVARIGSANSTPRIPNRAPISSCMASTSAGARSTVSPRDVRDDQIAVDVLDEEIDEDRVQALLGPGAEADRDHQHAGDDRADVGDEGEHAGDQPEQRGHRHPAERQHDPGEHAFEDHPDQPAEQQPAQGEADMVGDPVEARRGGEAAASRRCRGRRSAARRRGRCR